ncbi:hypothetical protein WAE56_00585 [Iodobacter sp. LRB]|uniref:COG4648 family protein n=1 Tax=unclassified Iodobacter TaxID=235634 RepID=UPI000C0FE15A|nr:hypothetical protein [Iodobacter sp. BJB302]PHV03727.1 hypothetical protein CSQ88_00595 [Iodobacter sp. BJB302]
MRTLVLGIITLAYPVLIYLGLGHFEPKWLALLLVAMALVRALLTKEKIWLIAAAGAALLAMVSFASNQLLPLKLYPVLVNGVLCAAFALSLAYPPSAIERLARLSEPDLPESGVRYTRRVTQVWCGFFIFNGCAALITAFWSDAAWALYNGLIAYLLMGVLFLGEWIIRRRVRAAYG